MKKILALLSALAIAGSVGAWAPQPEPLVVEHVELQEDDPGWDCLHHGNKICGAVISDVEDAWASFDGEAVGRLVGTEAGYRAAYVGSTGSTLLNGYWVVPSLKHDGTSHVFTISVG